MTESNEENTGLRKVEYSQFDENPAFDPNKDSSGITDPESTKSAYFETDFSWNFGKEKSTEGEATTRDHDPGERSEGASDVKSSESEGFVPEFDFGAESKEVGKADSSEDYGGDGSRFSSFAGGNEGAGKFDFDESSSNDTGGEPDFLKEFSMGAMSNANDAPAGSLFQHNDYSDITKVGENSGQAESSQPSKPSTTTEDTKEYPKPDGAETFTMEDGSGFDIGKFKDNTTMEMPKVKFDINTTGVFMAEELSPMDGQNISENYFKDILEGKDLSHTEELEKEQNVEREVNFTTENDDDEGSQSQVSEETHLENNSTEAVPQEFSNVSTANDEEQMSVENSGDSEHTETEETESEDQLIDSEPEEDATLSLPFLLNPEKKIQQEKKKGKSSLILMDDPSSKRKSPRKSPKKIREFKKPLPKTKSRRREEESRIKVKRKLKEKYILSRNVCKGNFENVEAALKENPMEFFSEEDLEETLFLLTRRKKVKLVRLMLEEKVVRPTALALNTAFYEPYFDQDICVTLLEFCRLELFEKNPHLEEKVKRNERAYELFTRRFR